MSESANSSLITMLEPNAFLENFAGHLKLHSLEFTLSKYVWQIQASKIFKAN